MANLNLKGSTFLIRPAQSVPKNFAFQPGSTYPQSHDETGGGGDVKPGCTLMSHYFANTKSRTLGNMDLSPQIRYWIDLGNQDQHNVEWLRKLDDSCSYVIASYDLYAYLLLIPQLTILNTFITKLVYHLR